MKTMRNIDSHSVETRQPEAQKKGILSVLGKIMKKARTAVLAGVMPILASCAADTQNAKHLANNQDVAAESVNSEETANIPVIQPGMLGNDSISLMGDYPGQVFLQADVYYENHDENNKNPDEVMQFSSVDGSYNFEGKICQNVADQIEREKCQTGNKIKMFTIKAAHDSEMQENIPITKNKEEAVKNGAILGSNRFPPEDIDKSW